MNTDLNNISSKSFKCRYAMYYHHRGVSSVCHGKDIIDAIKHSNQNAILVWIEDEDGQTYICKEHDEVSDNGYFEQYWVNENTGELLYDEKASYVKPTIDDIDIIDIIDTTTKSGWIDLDGVFYECGFEQHANLADYLLEIGFVEKGTCDELKNHTFRDDDMQCVLELRGWVKMSGGGIRHYSDNNSFEFTNKQIETIKKYYASINSNHVLYNGRKILIDEF